MPRHYLCNLLAFGAAGWLLLAGCGSESEGGLTISAASSLSEAFGAYDEQTEAVERFSFGGSDQLAAQIRQGATADVYAAASLHYPRRLFEEGLVGRPQTFASNTLVIAVPTDSAIRTIGDLATREFDLVIGSDGVPVGEYARDAISKLEAAPAKAILANVRSRESDVKAIIGKVSQGAADAGFAYASDVAANADLRAVELPEEIRPRISYAIAPVISSKDPEGAEDFIDGLRSTEGRAALEAAGFEVRGR